MLFSPLSPSLATPASAALLHHRDNTKSFALAARYDLLPSAVSPPFAFPSSRLVAPASSAWLCSAIGFISRVVVHCNLRKYFETHYE